VTCELTKITITYDPKIKQFTVFGFNNVDGKWDQDGAPLYFSALEDVVVNLLNTFPEAIA
jgi:hypothetical protein